LKSSILEKKQKRENIKRKEKTVKTMENRKKNHHKNRTKPGRKPLEVFQNRATKEPIDLKRNRM
jgi:hypothetical protein